MAGPAPPSRISRAQCLVTTTSPNLKQTPDGAGVLKRRELRPATVIRPPHWCVCAPFRVLRVSGSLKIVLTRFTRVAPGA